jgi:hypothetical protein
MKKKKKKNTLKTMGNTERNVTDSEVSGFCDEQRLRSALIIAE